MRAWSSGFSRKAPAGCLRARHRFGKTPTGGLLFPAGEQIFLSRSGARRRSSSQIMTFLGHDGLSKPQAVREAASAAFFALRALQARWRLPGPNALLLLLSGGINRWRCREVTSLRGLLSRPAHFAPRGPQLCAGLFCIRPRSRPFCFSKRGEYRRALPSPTRR